MSMVDEANEEVYEQVRAILAEHFPSFMFCVMDDAGGIYYDYTNIPIGKMLVREMESDMAAAACQDEDWDFIGWDESEDDYESWG